jgi:predicted ABC-type ATPase
LASSSPVFVIVGGPNGCGKSTFAKNAAGTGLLLGETTINPDDITQSVHAEFRRFSRRGANVVAAERTEKAVWRAIAEGRNVAVETVLSTDKYRPFVTAARARGYRTRLIFVAVADAERAIERVAIRREREAMVCPKRKYGAVGLVHTTTWSNSLSWWTMCWCSQTTRNRRF